MPYWVTFMNKNGGVEMRGHYTRMRAERKMQALEDNNVPNVELHHTITSDQTQATRIIRERLANRHGADKVTGNFMHKPKQRTKGVLYSEA